MTPQEAATARSLGAIPKARQKPWWKGAVIYQIYPRSFLDTTGDGIGDLRGIIERLDHVASLGVDAVWLSPFFKSPMHDYGYDVADYRAVDPMFGTLDDFDCLVEKCHRLGMRIVIDQVYSHTSNEHEWFLESRHDRTNPKADWYVWADPKPDGSPPNNWQSVFGGGAWEWNANRNQYYFHNFLTSQPDLNLHNPEVQNALLDVATFWFERGVDGFRLDAINFGMHDPLLRDNPPETEFKRPPTRPFDYQKHIYSQSHPDIVKFLERIRKVADKYQATFTVAEVGGPRALPEMKAFTEGDTRLNSAYSFEYLYADELTPDYVKKVSRDWPNGEDTNWPSWAFSNHDAPRCISRWAGKTDQSTYAKMTLLLLTALRGNAFIYQGEELGLPQANVPFEMLKDPEAIANWPKTLGRDGARTPMPWISSAPNAGFTSGNPWLPVDSTHLPLSVERQEANADSVLAFARRAVALRKSTKSLALGDIEFVDGPEGLLIFERRDAEETVLCVFNLSENAISWEPQNAVQWKLALHTNAKISGRPPTLLPPGEAYIAIKM